MKPIILILGGITLTGSLLVAGISSGDDEYEHGWRSDGWSERMGRDVAPVDDPLYAEECGGCHMAYPAGLLPAGSWSTLMANLDDHFGDNAEVMPETTAELTTYLTANAADRSDYRRSRGIAASAGGTVPLRISETRYFVRKHDEIPPRLVRDNPDVGSWSNCASCHRGAERGFFDEHQVRIPGFGRWDD